VTLLVVGAAATALLALHNKSDRIEHLQRERSTLRSRNAALITGMSASRESARSAKAELATARGKLRRLRSAGILPGNYGNVYIGRSGDTFRVPAAAAQCTASGEGGIPNLYCTHFPGVRYQVYFYSDQLQVWQNGNPDAPVFSELP
jgi:hypothetical protein